MLYHIILYTPSHHFHPLSVVFNITGMTGYDQGESKVTSEKDFQYGLQSCRLLQIYIFSCLSIQFLSYIHFYVYTFILFSESHRS